MKWIRIINLSIFLIVFSSLAYTNSVYVARGFVDDPLVNAKYFIMSFGIVIGIIQLIYKNKNQKPTLHFTKEFVEVIVLIFSFLLISLTLSLLREQFTQQTIIELFKMLIAILYAFCVLNTIDYPDFYKCMVVILFVSLYCYILEIGINKFSIINLESVSYFSSYSPFESSMASSFSILCCTFFMYFKEKPIYKILSLLFVFLTFKRLSIVYAILLLIFTTFFDVNRRISKNWINILKISFVLLTLIYYALMLPQNQQLFSSIFHSSQFEFSMGRSRFLANLSDYQSFGFGSTTQYLGKNMEMDLIKILLELSIVGLILFISIIWDVCGTNFYNVFFMFYIFMNMLTSHSLGNPFSWALSYILIGYISVFGNSYYRNHKLKYLSIWKKDGRTNPVTNSARRFLDA
jgi:hypothetical protein